MKKNGKVKTEFGDFQTPKLLADKICRYLKGMDILPDILVEPTCGLGTFLISAIEIMGGGKEIFGFDINQSYVETAVKDLEGKTDCVRTHIENIDFFEKDWEVFFNRLDGRPLVIGNLPWVTNTTLGAIGGSNLPHKTNFLGMRGFDAISGKSNFDISEWMLLKILRCLSSCGGDVALLVKSSVARKILSHAEREGIPIVDAQMVNIEARKYFSVAVDACVFIVRIAKDAIPCYDCTLFSSFEDAVGKKIGRRNGLLVRNIDNYNRYAFILGSSPKKWRSGIKHDASKVMELIRCGESFKNGLGERVEIESEYLFPLMKGADIGSNKSWNNKFVLVTQQFVGSSTSFLKVVAPKTWRYLEDHAKYLDTRASTIYMKNPRFSIFGVGDYAFKPWRIAICSLYKNLKFRLIGPIEDRPVMFDDTVYYLSFDTQLEASKVLDFFHRQDVLDLLSSLIFWDEKRPIKTSILNLVDWSKTEVEVDSSQFKLAI